MDNGKQEVGRALPFTVAHDAHPKCLNLYLTLPLNMGAILNTPKPPIVNICPNASSMKNMGMPANISVKKYGTRKAPPPFL